MADARACPRCGCKHVRVTTVRPLSNGRVRRYRICRHCGTSYTTVELVESEAPEVIVEGEDLGTSKTSNGRDPKTAKTRNPHPENPFLDD